MDNVDEVRHARTNARQVYVTLAPPRNEGIGVVQIWNELWDKKWTIVAVSLLLGIAAVFFALSATPVYRSEAVLAPSSQDAASRGTGAFGGLATLAGINLEVGNDRTELIAMLESKWFVEEFIREKGLLPVLYSDRWDSEAQKWKGTDPAEHPDLRDAVKYFAENIRFILEDQPRTGLVTLAIEWTDPGQAAQWATELVSRANERARSRDIAELQRKLDYLNDQLSKATLVELRLAISRVIEDQINAMMLAQAQNEYAFKVIDPAVVPKQRIWPKRTLIVLVALFLGGFIGAFFVLVRFAIRYPRPSSAA